MRLAPQDFIATIWQERRRYVREGRIKQPHPWRVALSEGRVSRKALVEYVKNRYYFLANINAKTRRSSPTVLSPMRVVCCSRNISTKRDRTSPGASSDRTTKCGLRFPM